MNHQIGQYFRKNDEQQTLLLYLEPQVQKPAKTISLRLLLTKVAKVVSSLPSRSEASLTFGIKRLDNLLRCGFPSGHLSVIHGSRGIFDLSLLAVVRSQMSDTLRGAVFVDGANSFNPYVVSTMARTYGLDSEEILREVLVSRAFTAFQLQTLISERLELAVREHKARLVVVSDLPALYFDSEVKPSETIRLFNLAVNKLTNLASKYNLVTIATASDQDWIRHKRVILELLFKRADVLLKVEEKPKTAKFILQKHPRAKAPQAVEVALNLANQTILEEFMEANLKWVEQFHRFAQWLKWKLKSGRSFAGR